MKVALRAPPGARSPSPALTFHSGFAILSKASIEELIFEDLVIRRQVDHSHVERLIDDHTLDQRAVPAFISDKGTHGLLDNAIRL
jgi:hypothetical protein